MEELRNKRAPKIMICPYCDETFSTRTLKTHIQIHYETPKPPKCEECNKVLKNHRSLKAHMIIHKKADFVCDVCSRHYPQKKYLKHHKKTIHDVGVVTGRKWVCRYNLCGSTTSNEAVLNFQDKKHGKKNVFHCEHCDYTVRFRSALTRHLTKVHGSIQNVKCLDCNKMLVTQAEIDLHMSQLHRLRKYQCHRCYRYFTHSSGLNKHLRRICQSYVINEDESLDADNEVIVIEEIVKSEDGDEMMQDEKGGNSEVEETIDIKEEDIFMKL